MANQTIIIEAIGDADTKRIAQKHGYTYKHLTNQCTKRINVLDIPREQKQVPFSFRNVKTGEEYSPIPPLPG